MRDTLNHLGSIWYHSEPSDVPYFPNQFLALDFFCCFLQQDCSSVYLIFCVRLNFTLAKNLYFAHKRTFDLSYDSLLKSQCDRNFNLLQINQPITRKFCIDRTQTRSSRLYYFRRFLCTNHKFA